MRNGAWSEMTASGPILLKKGALAAVVVVDGNGP
jgi:hypothetical protein